MVAEVVWKKEMTILVVGICREFKTRELWTAFWTNGWRRRFLLCNNGRKLEFTKLHVGAHTKEWRRTTHQRWVGRHAHITRFNEFDNFIFFTLVAQLQALCVKVEGRFRVIVKVHVYLVAHFTIEAQVNFFIKVKAKNLAVALWKTWVVCETSVSTNF